VNPTFGRIFPPFIKLFADVQVPSVSCDVISVVAEIMVSCLQSSLMFKYLQCCVACFMVVTVSSSQTSNIREPFLNHFGYI
jgi:hypothetical protein